MSEIEEVDVIVLGLGVGGEEVAGRLAEAGLNVIGIDNTLVGGECPYWGCIPTKMMVRAAGALEEARRIPGLAGTSTVTPDWSPVAKRIRDQATDDWNDKVAVDRFEGKGGRFVRGTGEIVGAGSVRVGPRTYAATRALVLATGTKAVVPPVEGLAGTPYWTNREAVEAAALPKSLLVLGGGAIGCEFAQVFARFGVPVTIIEGSGRVLAMEEPESSEVAARALEADGIRILAGVRAAAVAHDGAEFSVRLSDGSSVTGEKLLVATGRAAKLDGVEHLGIDPASRFIKTDEWMRAADRVWAVGDVTGNGVFTHMAFYEADVAVRDILGQGGPAADYRAKPRVTFIDPEIGAVGLTEREAREAGLDVRVSYLPLSSTTRGWIHGPGGDGFIKLVAAGDVLVGATTAGPAGGEMIGAMSVAVHAQVPIATLRGTIWAYPTFHRGFGQALSQL